MTDARPGAPLWNTERRRRRRELLHRVCAVHAFEPAGIEEFGEAECRQLLGEDIDELDLGEGEKRPWALRTDARIEGLTMHDSPRSVLAAMLRLAPVDTPAQRTYVRWLEAAAAGGDEDDREQHLGALASDRDALETIPYVLSWLEGVSWARPYVQQSRSALWRTRRRAELTRMGGPSFVGRETELAILRRYVADTDQSLIALDAVGGMGKSALLAAFELELDLRGDGIVAIHLDFDDPRLDARVPVTVFARVFELLSYHVPAFAELAEPLASRWFDPSSPEERNLGDALLLSILPRAGGLVERARDAGVVARVVLVFDAFERVLRDDEGAAREVIALLRTAFPPTLTRFIVSGRGVADDRLRSVWYTRVEPISLGVLPVRTARELLAKLGVHGKFADRLLDIVPRLPLTLRLVALAKKEVHAGLDLDELRAAVERRLGDGYLHLRILDHVPDRRVAALLQLGFVLRRLTPTLALDLLHDVPSPPIADLADARQLVDKLRRMNDLVADGSSPAELVLRDELRDQVLVLVRADEPERVAGLHLRCARYFWNYGDVREAAFHTRMARPAARAGEVERELGGLDTAALREFVASELGRHPTRYQLHPFEQLVCDGRLEEADAYTRRPDYPSTAEMLRIEAKLRRLQGRVEDAAHLARRALPGCGSGSAKLDLLRVLAWAAMQSSFEEPGPIFSDAVQEVARPDLAPIEVLAACADLAMTAAMSSRRDVMAFRGRFQDQVRHLLSTIPEHVLSQDRVVLLAATSVSGRPEHLRRALELGALDGLRDFGRTTLHALVHEPLWVMWREHRNKLQAFDIFNPPFRGPQLARMLDNVLFTAWPVAEDLVRRVVAFAHHVATAIAPGRAELRARALDEIALWFDVNLTSAARAEIVREVIPNSKDVESVQSLVLTADREGAIMGLLYALAERAGSREAIETLLRIRRRIVPLASEYEGFDRVLQLARSLKIDADRVRHLLEAWRIPWVGTWSSRPEIQLAEALDLQSQYRGAELEADLQSMAEAAGPASGPEPELSGVSDPFDDVLLPGDRPFVNRAELRRHLRDLTSREGAPILRIGGPPRSGKSYSIYLIEHAATRHGFSVHAFSSRRAMNAGQITDELLAAVGDARAKRAESDTEPREVQRCAELLAGAFRRRKQRTLLVFDKMRSSSEGAQELVIALARYAEAELYDCLRLVLIDFGAELPLPLAQIARTELVIPFGVADMMDALHQIAVSHRWDLKLEGVREILAYRAGDLSLRGCHQFLRQLISDLRIANIEKALQPRLIARFSLDREGRPRREKLGQKEHFAVILQIENRSSGARRVVYKFNASFKDATRTITQVPRFLKDGWAYRNCHVRARVIDQDRGELRLSAMLVDMLRLGHATDMTPAIEAAIEELRKNG
jgi:hypothetical protein